MDSDTTSWVILWACGAMLGIWHIGTWLRHGQWPSFSCYDLLEWLLPSRTRFLHWLRSPTDWYGLHKIVTMVLSVPCFMVAWGLGAWLTSIGSDMHEKERSMRAEYRRMLER